MWAEKKVYSERRETADFLTESSVFLTPSYSVQEVRVNQAKLHGERKALFAVSGVLRA